MKKAFIERVKRERIVDTKAYRYIVKDGRTLKIMRLALEDLDTTAAIDGWETVYEEER